MLSSEMAAESKPGIQFFFSCTILVEFKGFNQLEIMKKSKKKKKINSGEMYEISPVNSNQGE